jgi:hypothetical protein
MCWSLERCIGNLKLSDLSVSSHICLALAPHRQIHPHHLHWCNSYAQVEQGPCAAAANKQDGSAQMQFAHMLNDLYHIVTAHLSHLDVVVYVLLLVAPHVSQVVQAITCVLTSMQSSLAGLSQHLAAKRQVLCHGNQRISHHHSSLRNNHR